MSIITVPGISIVFIVIAFVISVIGIGIASFTIHTHVTTETNTAYEGQDTFGKLTLSGNLEVLGGVVCHHDLHSRHDVTIDKELYGDCLLYTSDAADE